MKKMFIVMIVVAMAVGACGKKKDPAMAKPADTTTTTPPPAGDGAGTQPAEGTTPPADPPK